MMRYLLFVVILISSLATASEDCVGNARCIEQQQFHMSWALGYGQRSNPLNGTDELPLVLIPDIYYYAENWFFDNGIIGRSYSLNESIELSLLGQLTPDKGYFHKWFASNIFTASQASTLVGVNPKLSIQSDMAVNADEVSSRPTAFDIGIQLDWFTHDWRFQTVLWQDVSASYHGQYASAGASRTWQLNKNQLQLNMKLHWKSAKLIDTYYGIDDNEPLLMPRYRGRPSWQPELRLGWQRPLTDKIALLALFRYVHLDSAMTESPLVRDNNITTWFLGVSYRFY